MHRRYLHVRIHYLELMQHYIVTFQSNVTILTGMNDRD